MTVQDSTVECFAQLPSTPPTRWEHRPYCIGLIARFYYRAVFVSSCVCPSVCLSQAGTDMLRLAAAGSCDIALNFSTARCTTRLISVEKHRKHVLMRKVVTLNTCCDSACLTFQLPHITTGSFQSHRRQPTTDCLQSLQRLKERNRPSVRLKSFAFHKLAWWHFQVRLASELQIVFFRDNLNN